MARNELFEEVKQELSQVNFLDDDYARIFFDDNIKDTQLVLRIIMDKQDLVVISVNVQKKFYGPDEAHGVTFDIYAVDSENRQYDIELQNDSEGAIPQRADYNCAMMTVNTLKKRERYSELARRERVVIFITKHDVFRGNFPLYTVKRVIQETGKDFNDGTYIFYVNTAHKDYTTALGKLIHDFNCKGSEDLCYHELTETARCIKRDEGGKFVKSIDKIRAEERAEATAEATAATENRTYKNVALDLIRLGKNALDDIAQVCHLTLEQVQEHAATVKVNNS